MIGPPGIFLVFEGPEGSGKSTQARLLADRLEGQGRLVVRVREPGGTEVGELIRALLLDPGNQGMLAETEALLYAAARAQLVGQVLRPALTAGAVVVCDRYLDSSLAYQGGGRGLPRAELAAIQRFATGGLVPDLRILLDLPVTVGLRRRFADNDQVNRLDRADMAFHERVRSEYLALARADPAGWIVLDAEAPAPVIARQIGSEVQNRLECHETKRRLTAGNDGGRG